MNLVWGYLADRGGFRAIFVISNALYVAAIAGMIFAGSLPLMLVAFVGIGAAQSGYLMSTTNIVLEFGHAHDVPMRMALSNTAEGLMGALAPLIGGVLAVAWGYTAAFAASLACVSIALVLSVWKVDEPRRRKP
jgi:MFS family permease